MLCTKSDQKSQIPQTAMGPEIALTGSEETR